MAQQNGKHIYGLKPICDNFLANALGPVLTQQPHAVEIISANGSTVFNKSCSPIG